jgi:uncharacterized protein DUF4832
MPEEFHEKIRFTERCAPLLRNPHKGCATFQRFNGDPLNEGKRWSEEGPLAFAPAATDVTDGYLPCSVAYCRWFWDVLEPAQGTLDWTPVEQALATAASRGQTLQVRLMPHGSVNQPQLPAWYQSRYPTSLGGKKTGGKYVEARYDGPEFYDTWGRVITEFAARFDGHPQLESVDMAFIGPWGEGAGDISENQIERFIALYTHAHTRTPLLANTDGYQFVYGIDQGAGWRCDCFGDLGLFGRKWNHTYDAYPRAVVQAGAQDRWQTQPVVFETCGVPLTWQEHGFDLDFILRQGYKFHCSILMPKSNRLPDEYMEPLARFCDRIGYRLVLRQAMWSPQAPRGGELELSLWIENTGTAPLYHPYDLVLRLRGAGEDRFVPIPANVRAWLPGDAWLEEPVRVPADLSPGTVQLAVGLVDELQRPRVRFAVEETDAEGWVPLGQVEIG